MNQIIDSHAHLWRRASTPQPWIDLVTMSVIDHDFWIDDLAAHNRACGTAGSVLVQSANSIDETRDLLAVADGRIARGVVGWIDLGTDVPTQLATLAEAPGGSRLVGIRHLAHQDPDPRWLERPEIAFGLESLATAGLPFDLVILPEQLELAAATVARHPNLAFVLDHIGKPPLAGGDLREWRAGIRAIARHKNVVAKLSGIVVEAEWSGWTVAQLRAASSVAIESFGPERLMFGSDWPVVELAGGAVRWLEAARELVSDFTPAELAGFFAENAIATYRLDSTNA